LLFNLPSSRMVMPSCAIPYSAREPSAVAVFIERMMPAQRQRMASPVPLPRIWWKVVA